MITRITMENEFIYWRHPTIPGIKVEEVSGGDRYSGRLWEEMARQVYCENGKESYREIGHFHDGAPFIFGSTSRISVSHCKGLYVVATLPPTPEVDLSIFSPRAALGIDAEREDRSQTLKVRRKFLSDAELALIPEDDVKLNVLAWTVKEAAYKAARITGLDLCDGIRIKKLPSFAPPTPVFDSSTYDIPNDKKEFPESLFGEVVIVCSCSSGNSGEENANELVLRVYSYLSEECVVTLCYDPRCAKFNTRN